MDQRGPRLAPGELPRAPKEIALTEGELVDYVGSYRKGPVMFTVKPDGARLLVQLTGQPVFQVFASAKDQVSYKVVDAKISSCGTRTESSDIGAPPIRTGAAGGEAALAR